MPFSAPPTDAEICAWHEAQSEEFLRDLFDRFDASTPRECWHAFFCPPPAAQTVATSLPAPAAGQGAGTLHNAAVAVAVSGNELRKGRARVHASPAARTAAYRANRARVDYTDTPETVAKLHGIAQALDCSANELLRSMVRFALLNRNWRQVGLFGARRDGELL